VESFYKFQRILIINVNNCSCHCAGQFQVAKADENDDKGDEKRSKDENKKGRQNREWRSEDRNEERDEEQEQEGNENIISPASYVNLFFLL
jgi:hypothetical protein